MYKEKCYVCKKEIKDGDDIIPVVKYVTNEKRGDFVTTQGHAFIHAHHLKAMYFLVLNSSEVPAQ